MNSLLWSALFLNFGAAAAASLARIPRYNLSPLSYQIGWLLLLLGVPAGLFAIYLFVQAHGWGYGLLVWLGSGVLSQLLLMFLFEGLRTIVGMTCPRDFGPRIT
jgi:hypothetical protein